MITNLVRKKAVISGKVVEVYEYGNPYLIGTEKRSKGRAGQTETTQEQKAENRSKVLQRARQHIRRLANSNTDLTKFLTLTFRDNLQNLQQANKVFKDFILRLKYYCRKELKQVNVKYVCVVEFQKRGAVHYHLLCNLPYIDVKRLERIWAQGFVKINRIDNVDNVGAYITKYMSKDTSDERLIGNRSYFTSANLSKPIEVYEIEHIEQLEQSPALRTYQSEFETDQLGLIKYKQIICKSPIDIKLRT